MKQKHRFYTLSFKSRKLISQSLLFGGVPFILTNCLYKQDRTTVIYGTITDQNQQHVDSILVSLQGVAPISNYKALKVVYSDTLGNYEIVAEVPKDYSQTIVGIPFFPLENPKF